MPTAVTTHHRGQSLGEEVANTISHGLGLAATLVGTPLLLRHVADSGVVNDIIGASIFSATMILLYLSSTLYHAFPPGQAKRVFRIIEHSAIFLLIAGTYTPFTLGILNGEQGWVLFGIVWTVAISGIVLKTLGRVSHPVISTGLYLVMGWLIIIAIDPLLEHMPTAGLLWLLAGGLSYSLGVIFYATDQRLRYGHLIWHLFVLGGTVCHYFAVYGYAAKPI